MQLGTGSTKIGASMSVAATGIHVVINTVGTSTNFSSPTWAVGPVVPGALECLARRTTQHAALDRPAGAQTAEQATEERCGATPLPNLTAPSPRHRTRIQLPEIPTRELRLGSVSQ